MHNVDEFVRKSKLQQSSHSIDRMRIRPFQVLSKRYAMSVELTVLFGSGLLFEVLITEAEKQRANANYSKALCTGL